MSVEHVIVVRVRGDRIVLSTDELRMTNDERLRWVSERGRPFKVMFKDDKAPFGNGGVHETDTGVIHVAPASPPGPPGGSGPTREVFHYAVTMEGLPVLDPKIVFETPPDDRRGN